MSRVRVPLPTPQKIRDWEAIPIPDFFFRTGVSPSGKARDFDSLIRWFESSHPCQILTGPRGSVFIRYAPLAQSVEHLPFKQGVRGSNPRRGTKKQSRLTGGFAFWCFAPGESKFIPPCGVNPRRGTKKQSRLLGGFAFCCFAPRESKFMPPCGVNPRQTAPLPRWQGGDFFNIYIPLISVKPGMGTKGRDSPRSGRRSARSSSASQGT